MLREVTSGAFVPARLDRMTAHDVAVARESWGHEFVWRRHHGAHDDDAIIWTRGMMSAAASARDSDLAGFVIRLDDEIQGIVVFDGALHNSRLQPAARLVYIQYLATAPWNRRFYACLGRYGRVGRALVARAIAESNAAGCCGRVGLHSFASATAFYDRLGFVNFGADALKRGMPYFELPPEAASALLAPARGR